MWKSDRSFATCSMSFSLGRMVVLQGTHVGSVASLVTLHRLFQSNAKLLHCSLHSPHRLALKHITDASIPEVIGAICLLEAAARHRHDALHSADEGQVILQSSKSTAATDTA